MASYGIHNYFFAITQLAQTTMRSEMGKIDLDKTFEERTTINSSIVGSIDEAAKLWGVKVLRYEIKNIVPPKSVLVAMEKQMQAEREKRAIVLESEGERLSAINVAEGQTRAITEIATATAEGLKKVAEAISVNGGMEAVQLRVAEKTVEQFGDLAKATNTLILPSNFGDMSSIIATAMTVVKHMEPKIKPQ